MDFKSWNDMFEIDENTSLTNWLSGIVPIMETTSTKYSIECNYRSTPQEVLEAFAKICLGFVSAALKQNSFHTKHVYETKPLRLFVSSRNWDDGEWVCVVSFNHEQKCFVVSKGFYNKDRKTVSIQNSNKCAGDSAADIVKEVRTLMHNLRNEKDRHTVKLKGVPLKRGPKK